jgi:hypothetical protein
MKIIPGYNYCYKLPSGLLMDKGENGCNKGEKCGECQGNCKYDTDCLGDLVCFIRSDYTTVPGCQSRFPGSKPDYGYCIPPFEPLGVITLEFASSLNEKKKGEITALETLVCSEFGKATSKTYEPTEYQCEATQKTKKKAAVTYDVTVMAFGDIAEYFEANRHKTAMARKLGGIAKRLVDVLTNYKTFPVPSDVSMLLEGDNKPTAKDLLPKG